MARFSIVKGASRHESSESEEAASSQQDEQRLLTWAREDPEESFCDWTVEIIRDNGTIETYYVHKNVLAFGEYYSQYFVALFQKTNTLQENKEKTSKIRLPDLAAKAFPVMLDFMYGAKNIDTSNNEVGLCFLADYFQVATLERNIKRKMSKKVTLENASQYYDEALSFEIPVQAVVDQVEQVCVNEFDDYGPFFEDLTSRFSKVLTVLTPESLRTIIGKVLENTSDEDKRRDVSENLSELVAEYCQHHHEKINEETFNSFTTDDMLPSISFDAAHTLIELQNSITGTSEKKPLQEESELERRCFEVIEEMVDTGFVDLSDCSDGTLLFLMTRSPERAAKSIAEMTSRTDEASRHYHSIELKRVHETHSKELKSIHERHSRQLSDVQENAAQALDAAAAARKELEETKRKLLMAKYALHRFCPLSTNDADSLRRIEGQSQPRKKRAILDTADLSNGYCGIFPSKERGRMDLVYRYIAPDDQS